MVPPIDPDLEPLIHKLTPREQGEHDGFYGLPATGPRNIGTQFREKAEWTYFKWYERGVEFRKIKESLR